MKTKVIPILLCIAALSVCAWVAPWATNNEAEAQITYPPSAVTVIPCQASQQTITTTSGWNVLATCPALGMTPSTSAIIETDLFICGNPSGSNTGNLAVNLWVNGSTTASTGGLTMTTSSTCYTFEGRVALAGALNAWNVWSDYSNVNGTMGNLGATALQTSTIGPSTVIEFEGFASAASDKYTVSGWERVR